MPDVEYSTRLFVSSVLWGNIWVWPFLFIDWRRFCLPLLNGSGYVMQQEAMTWHFAPSRDLWGKNEDGDMWAVLPQHISVNTEKLGKEVYIQNVFQVPWTDGEISAQVWRKSDSTRWVFKPKTCIPNFFIQSIQLKIKSPECITFSVLPIIYNRSIVIIQVLSFTSLFLQLPGKKYAPGFNEDVGDKYIWLK